MLLRDSDMGTVFRNLSSVLRYWMLSEAILLVCLPKILLIVGIVFTLCRQEGFAFIIKKKIQFRSDAVLQGCVNMFCLLLSFLGHLCMVGAEMDGPKEALGFSFQSQTAVLLSRKFWQLSRAGL